MKIRYVVIVLALFAAYCYVSNEDYRDKIMSHHILRTAK